MEVTKTKNKKRLSGHFYYFTDADDSFVRYRPPEPRSQIDTYKFRQPEMLIKPLTYEKDGLPLAFRISPDSLLDMTTKIIQKWELPSVYTWSTEKICQWIREYGYPQYQNIFRENMINGRTLLLVDAAALSAMNIKDFDHIRHITYGIRSLFQFEITNYARSISLPPQNYIELYKLFRVKTGIKYERSNVIDLWRRMELVAPPIVPTDHWQRLEQSLGHQPEPPLIRIGRMNPKKPRKLEAAIEVQCNKVCSCSPPCECSWTHRHLRQPWKLKALQNLEYWTFQRDSVPLKKKRSWSLQKTTGVLLLLSKLYPERYNTIKSRPMLSL